MVLNLICSNSGTEQEAKDIYQEAIIAFYERICDEKFVLTCKIKTFLYAVCWRMWLKRLSEKKKYTGNIEHIEKFEGMDEVIAIMQEKEKQFNNMSSSMEKLGEPCKSILIDFYVNNQTMEEISAKFGYTNADNAKNQKYKCLQRLKKLFFANYNQGS